MENLPMISHALREYIHPNALEPINGFVLVKSSASKSYYLCFGRHDFFLVPRQALTPASSSDSGLLSSSSPPPPPITITPSASSTITGTKSARRLSMSSTLNHQPRRIQLISYRAVEKIMKCTDSPESCIIVFTPGTLLRFKADATSSSSTSQSDSNNNNNTKATVLPPLQLMCSERERLLTELIVGIKASHMFLTFEVHTKEMVEEYSTPKEPSLVAVSSSSSSTRARRNNNNNSSSFSSSGSQQQQQQLQQQQQQLQITFHGYCFARPPDYDEVPRPGLLKKQFDRPAKGSEVQFEIGKASHNPYVKLDAASLHFEVCAAAGGGGTLQSVAERFARAICSQVEDYRLVQRPCALPKRCLNDPSVWQCWMTKFRTLKSTQRALEYRLVTLIACRRSFTPPSMTSSCDFVITHFSQYNDLDNTGGQDVAERVLESLHPEAKTFDKDEFLIQHTLDALLLDRLAWQFLDNTLKLRPVIHDTLMRKFCRTLVEFLLEQENAHSVWTPAQKIQNVSLMNAWDAQAQQQFASSAAMAGSVHGKFFSTMTNRYLQSVGTKSHHHHHPAHASAAYASSSVSSSSVHVEGGGDASPPQQQQQQQQQAEEEVMIATLMGLSELAESHPPGLDATLREEGDEDTRRDWAAWRKRVWAYLAYCLDGAVYHQVLDFEVLTRVWKATNTKHGLRLAVGAVLDRCINLESGTAGAVKGGGGGSARPTLRDACIDSINAPSISFNATALSKLLKTGYVQACLSDRDSTLFSKFLVRLLFFDTDGGRGGGGGSDDEEEPIAYAVLKTLVSFSQDEDREANLNLLVPALIRVFMSHPEDDRLRTWCLGTLVNFSRNNNAVKSNILAGGGFAREIILLLRSRDDDLVRHACSLLLNLAKTSSEFRHSLYRGQLKHLLVDLLKRAQLPNVRARELFRAPKILALAAQILGHLAVEEDVRWQLLEGDETQNDSDGLFRIPALVRQLADLACRDSQHLGDEVRFSTLFALKNLSVGASGVRAALGRYASRDLVRLLRDKDVKDAMVVDYLMRVIYSLCWDAKIASKLVSEKLLDGLALRKQDFPNLCLQIKAKLEANSQQQQTGGGGGEGVRRGSEADLAELEAPSSSQQGGITGGILRAGRASRSSAAT